MTSHIQTYLLQAYLNNELDVDTQTEFELELMRNPELAELASADTALLIGLSSVNASVPEQATDTAAKVVALPLAGALKPVYKPQTPWTRFAAAASILMVLAGTLGYTFKPSPQLLGGAQLAYIDKQRATDHSIQITLPQAGPLVLMVPVASTTECLADISITQLTLGTQPVKAGSKFSVQAQPDSFGYAVVVVANAVLKPGSAAISVACQGKNVGQYEIDILPNVQ